MAGATLFAVPPTGAQSAATPVYDVENLLSYGGNRFSPVGDIAGFEYGALGFGRPSIRLGGMWHTFPLPPGQAWGVFTALNSPGQAVGYTVAGPGFVYQPITGTGTGTDKTLTVMTDVNVPPNAENYGINDDGVIVGCRRDSDNSSAEQALVGSASGLEFLFGQDEDESSCAYDVNNAGQVVGYRGPAFEPRAFRYSVGSGGLEVLETTSGYLRQARAVNELGEVAGSGDFIANPPAMNQALVFTAAGTIVDLGVARIGAAQSAGYGINAAGDVVGGMTLASSLGAFLATGGQAFDLNSLIPAGSGWTLQFAYDIDDQDRILVGGTIGGAAGFALLTPRAPLQVSNGLVQAIQQLREDGVLNSGNANALTTKVQGAIKAIESGNSGAAANKLQVFINQVEAFARSGTLTAQTGQSLTEAARWLIASLA